MTDKSRYETFSEKAKTLIRYNKGKNIEPLLKKIYLKYINQGSKNEVEVVNTYIMDLINNIKYIADVEDVENIINDYKNQKRLTSKEYNYLIDKLREKENELLQ